MNRTRAMAACCVTGLIFGCQTIPKVSEQVPAGGGDNATAFKSATGASPCAHTEWHKHYATLWMQTSAEYYANSLSAYRQAESWLDRAVADPTWTALAEPGEGFQTKPPAIITDIDETVLDNSPYQVTRTDRDLTEWEPDAKALWDTWLHQQSDRTVPGAVTFLQSAKAKGIRVVYISNRECARRTSAPSEPCPQEADTLESLKKAGLSATPDDLLLRNESGWAGEKLVRRQLVAKDFRVIMLIGDDLGDFMPDVKKSITWQRRRELVDTESARWGKSWFMLTNPTYGSWADILSRPTCQYTTPMSTPED